MVFVTAELIMLLTLFLPSKSLPFPAWYPWDKYQTPYYEISYFLQAFTSLIMAYAYANPDMLYVCVCLLLSGQFKILAVEYKNIMFDALIECGVSRVNAERFYKNCCIVDG